MPEEITSSKKVLTTLDVANSRIINLADPITIYDAANKNYVDILAASYSVFGSFGYFSSPPEYYNLVQEDLGRLITVNASAGDVDIRLPTYSPIGWWCAVVKEGQSNTITFSSPLTILSKGVTLDLSRSPAFLTYTDQNLWRIIGELSSSSSRVSLSYSSVIALS